MVIKIYHGTPDRNIKKFYDKKVRDNLDYGNGIYCTTNLDQAKEWSCKYEKRGAVYEFEIDLSSLVVLSYQQKHEEVVYLLYLCRIGLEDIAKETISGFEDADVVLGIMLDGNTKNFERLANKFNEGACSYEVLFEKCDPFADGKNQLCFKSELAIDLLNKSLTKIYYTTKEEERIGIESEKFLI